MSLQHPLRRWALPPLNLNITFPSETMMRLRLPTRRPFSLQLQSQKQTAFRTYQQQSQTQKLFRTRNSRSFHNINTRSNSNRSSGYTYQSPNPSPSLSQRLKTLSREYGWSALWIYLFLSALDFPFCFAAVRLLGADKIGHYEDVVVENLKGAIDGVWPGLFDKSKEEEEEAAKEAEAEAAEKKKAGSEGASMKSPPSTAPRINEVEQN
ncbi:hypothetical protein BJX99DRAFT_232958 [Aspergillus californicus]